MRVEYCSSRSYLKKIEKIQSFQPPINGVNTISLIMCVLECTPGLRPTFLSLAVKAPGT